MSGRQFLFVNKDAESSSLTRSSSKEQSSINSHVQRGRRHRRSTNPSTRRRVQINKHAPTEKVDSVDGSSPTSSTSSSSTIPIRATGFNTFVLTPDGGHKLLIDAPYSSDRRYSNESSDSKASARVRTAQQTAAGLVSFASPQPDEQLHPPPQDIPSREANPNDISQFAINPVDPFAEACVPIDSQSFKLMQYYRLVYHPAVWHAETQTSGKSTYTFQTSATEVLRNAMQSSVDMYALLACMSSRLQHVDQRPGQNTDLYLQKALTSTRKLLEQKSQNQVNSNEQILMIIFHLYAAEGYRENMKAAKIHLKGAKTIVDCIGGLNKLRDPQMRELLVIGDGHLSAIALEPCEFPCDFDPGPYHVAIPLESQLTDLFDLSSLAPAFRQRHRTGLIPTEIYALIEETAECTWVLQHAKQAPPERSKPAMRWVGTRQLAIRHRLQAMRLEDPRVDAIRVALMMWILITMTLLGLKKLSVVIAPKLQVLLKKVTTQNLPWDDHIDVRDWIISLGATCAAMGSIHEQWFVTRLAETFPCAGTVGNMSTEISTDDLFERLLIFENQFFYFDPVQRPRIQRLAQLLLPASKQSLQGPV